MNKNKTYAVNFAEPGTDELGTPQGADLIRAILGQPLNDDGYLYAAFGPQTRNHLRSILGVLEIFESMSGAQSAMLSERWRQRAKWGEQNHDDSTWALILGEEFGEVQQAILHDRFGGKSAGTVRAELVQVAAVALAWIECIDRRAAQAAREKASGLSDPELKPLGHSSWNAAPNAVKPQPGEAFSELPSITPSERQALQKVQDADDDGEEFEVYDDDPLGDVLESIKDQFEPPLLEISSRGHYQLTERGCSVLGYFRVSEAPEGEIHGEI